MVIKSYFEKNNTIIYNELTNTGKNPISELYYGGTTDNPKYSRFIFKFDTDRLVELYNNKTFANLDNIKHVLKITNTGQFDNTLDKQRAFSVDVILFRIEQEWDEGVGYDFTTTGYLIGEDPLVKISPSNWIDARLTEEWNGGNGVYSGSSSGVTVTTQHLDAGNEDIVMDITDEVNSIITGGTTNYGYGIAFSREIEELPVGDPYYIGLFTRHTQTFFEPYVETTYMETIQDDRENFYLDKNNKLYLYVNTGGQPTNLDELPTVIVKDSNDLTYSAYTAGDVTHVTKGVYSIDINVPTEADVAEDCMMFTDVWSNIKINGVTRPDIELDFVLTDSAKYYNIGFDNQLPKEYSFSLNGIKNQERIVRGDIRKVIVEANIPYTVNQKDVIDGVKYRLYVKEGPNEVTVIDYNDVNRSYNHNYFLLDTASLIPQTYYIDVKSYSGDVVKTHKDIIKFDIVSLAELNK